MVCVLRRFLRPGGGLLTVSLAVAAACAAQRPAVERSVPLNPRAVTLPGCVQYASAQQVGHTPSALVELSGLVRSERHGGHFWAHNDSGNAFELFLVSSHGELVRRFDIAGARPNDVEAVTLAPCGDGPRRCVILGDIGDNLRWRREYRLYRVEEPQLDAEPLRAEVMTFTLPNTPLNFEALFSDPRTGDLYVISKRKGEMGEVYALGQFVADATREAVLLRTLHHPSDTTVTAADLHPSGNRLLIRTYRAAYELRAPAGATVQELLRSGELVQVPSGPQPQGEAAAYEASGDGYLLGSEQERAPLLRVGCGAGSAPTGSGDHRAPGETSRITLPRP